jgi:hypothetical protein
MSNRGASRLGWCLFAGSAALLATGSAVGAVPSSAKLPAADRWDVLDVLFSLVYLAFSLVGALIVSRRSENVVGWLFCAIGFVNAAWVFALGYAIRAVVGEANWLPAGQVAAWLDNVLAVPGGWLILLVFFLFPTGRPPSARWGRLIWFAALAMGVDMVVAALEPGPVAQIEVGVDNPFGIASLGGPLGALEQLLGVAQALLAAAGVACLVVRFRRSGRLERLQIKWFAYASGFVLVMLIVITVHSIAKVGEGRLADPVASTLLFLTFLAIPISVGVAILRYRLYEIDELINRTLVYGVLTVTLVLVYIGSVVLIQQALRPLTGRESQLAVVVSTLAVAALFAPLRRRIQSFIDRRFYRSKYDARKTLEAFSAKLRDETNLDALSDELVTVVRDTMQPRNVSLWLRDSGGEQARKEGHDHRGWVRNGGTREAAKP